MSVITRDNIKLWIAALGVFISFFAFGVLHERITRMPYGDKEKGEEEKFHYFTALIGILFIFYYIVGQLGHLATCERKDTSRKILYVIAAIAYSSAMLCSNMALKWVAYPVQVVAKSAKPIPTIILTALIGKRKYTWKKYLFVVLIVVGVALFLYKKGKSGKEVQEKVWYGELLLLGSLLLDGLCGGFEERIRKESSPAPFSMMLAMNGIAAVIYLFASFGVGEVTATYDFIVRHPEIIWHILLLALAGCTGQVFIFYMVSHFGPLPVSIVTTTRKFFTVMFSVIFLGNALELHQWFGAFIVFGALFGDLFLNKKPPRGEPQPVPTEDTELKLKSVPLAQPESPTSDEDDKGVEKKFLEKV